MHDRYTNPRDDDTSRRQRRWPSNCERHSRSLRDVTSPPDARGIAADPQPGRCSSPHETPAVSDVANDPRLLEIARRFLGLSTVPFRATLFDKSSARNWLVSWHQDTALPLQECRDVPGWGPWSTNSEITYAHAPVTALARVVALRLPFDDSRKITGCVSFPERIR